MQSAGTSATERPRRAPAILLADGLDLFVGIFCKIIILVSGLALLAILGSNVFARYFLTGGGFQFAQELPERIFPWFIMAGVALAVQHGGHLAVETLLERLNARNGRRLLLFGHALIITSYGILCSVALRVADIMSIEKSPVLGLPSSYSYFALAGGCVAVMIATFAQLLRVASLGVEARPIPHPEDSMT